MFFTRQNINNGRLEFTNAMPMKDSTSTNESSFSNARKTYLEITPTHKLGVYDGNRDASSVMERRKAQATGKGTYNANGTPQSFLSPGDKNTVNRALRKTRSAGAIAPAKKGGVASMF
jgi:hypothetical protein